MCLQLIAWFFLLDVSLHIQRNGKIKIAHWTFSQWSGRASHLSVSRGVHRHLYDCTWFLFAWGAMNAGMTLKIRVEIRSEFPVKTVIKSSFQRVDQLPGRLRENKRCVWLRTVNAPVKSWLYGLLAHTIDAFTLILIFHPHFVSKWLEKFIHWQAKTFFCWRSGFQQNVHNCFFNHSVRSNSDPLWPLTKSGLCFHCR